VTDRDAVSAWLARYVEAWTSYDREQIRELFAEDATYRFHPFDEPIRGCEAIVEAWFDEPDEARTFEASYQPVAVDGDTAVAVGTSSYKDSPEGEVMRVYDNCFVIRFDGEGRCVDFVEWYVKRPDA
jgi:ketosteroid isomerase-like protein